MVKQWYDKEVRRAYIGEVWLEYLTKEQCYRCHWCSEPIFPLRMVRTLGLRAVWYDDYWLELEGMAGESSMILRVRRASVDHLKAMVEGGRDTRRNLVASCVLCNSWRGKNKHAVPPWSAHAG